ncbi:MAG: glutathione S-transferase domain-containing protein [Oceanobacter sp.]
MRNPEFRQQQQKATGRTTVPCLLIEDEQGKEQWMYESADIIRFLKGL